jgi:hypothetical protein
VDELIPARLRGRVDLIINSSFWLGTMFGAALLLGGGVLLRLGRGQRRLSDRQRDLPHGDQGHGPGLLLRRRTGVGGVTGPALFGKLVETGKEVNVFYGYLLGAPLMISAGVAEWFIGVEAAGRSLEDVAKPLTTHEEEGEGADAPA